MAELSIRDVEGMRQVRIDLTDETVLARRGAMSNLRGTIRVTPRLPGVMLRGTGNVLVCFTPHWNEHIYPMMTGGSIERSMFE